VAGEGNWDLSIVGRIVLGLSGGIVFRRKILSL
jgi:hypothetical protein